MLSGLDGKVAVVTGAAGGLGAAAALRLSREGCRVIVVDIDGDGARRVAESLPGQSIAVTADVSAEEGVERYLDEATHSFGRIDLHHLNAGIPGSAGGFPDLSAAEFDRVMAVNVRGMHGAAMYGGPLGIRVNAVAPGIVPTALFTPAGREDMVRRAAMAYSYRG